MWLSGVLYRRSSLCYATFFAAFTFAHRALCAAAIFFRAAAESVRFLMIGTNFVGSAAHCCRAFAEHSL
jgi:hypothetical protein